MIEWFADSHAHASTTGLGYEEVVRRFRAAGGRLIAVAQLTPGSYGFENSPEGVLKSLETHITHCNTVRKEFGGVLCLVGLHPATVDRLARSTRELGTLHHWLVNDLMKRMEAAIREGLVDGLGEFGRPHYPSLPESWILNELLLVESLRVAKDYGVPIHIHSENAGLITLRSVEILVDYVGIKRERVLMHHVPPAQASIYVEKGFYVSTVGKYEVVSRLGNRCSSILIESDYLDDPKRPGAVMYPWDIKNEVLRAVESGNLDASCARELLQANPLRYYGIHD